MARVTVEDCLNFVENRFELVMLASRRARQLSSGRADPLVHAGHDKSTVVALREVAAGKLNKEIVDAVDAAPVKQPIEFGEQEVSIDLSE